MDNVIQSTPPSPYWAPQQGPALTHSFPADSSLKGRKDISNDVWDDEGSV